MLIKFHLELGMRRLLTKIENIYCARTGTKDVNLVVAGRCKDRTRLTTADNLDLPSALMAKILAELATC
jgi:hypothetical protein